MDKPIISGDTIKIPSSLGHLVDVDLFIETALRDYGTPETLIPDIAISVSELVNNAVMHGNRQARDKMVTVRISRENNTGIDQLTLSARKMLCRPVLALKSTAPSRTRVV